MEIKVRFIPLILQKILIKLFAKSVKRSELGIFHERKEKPFKCVVLADRRWFACNKRKNLKFQMLAAVYNKDDHGQYCYTLK